MEQIFDLDPVFGAVALNVPKMAQNTKIVTHPKVFELGSSSLRIMFNYPRANNLWNRFLIQAPVFGLWPKTCPKWPKIEKLNSFHSFWARILPCSENHHLIMPKKFMDQNFNLGPSFWATAHRAQNGLKFENWTQFCITFRSHFYFFFALRPIWRHGVSSHLPLVLKIRGIDHLVFF